MNIIKPNHEIIDCHIHVFALRGDWKSWFVPFASPDAFFMLLRSCGISGACGSSIRHSEHSGFETARAQNRDVLEVASAYSGYFMPGLTVDPRFPEESCREIEHCYMRHGVRWIGELVGYMSGYGDDYYPAGSEEVYSLAQELEMPVNVHCGNLKDLRRICLDFPKLQVVLAHPGNGKGTYLERLAVVEEFPNLYLDLSGSGLMRYGMLRHGIDRAGAHKFLFGTDAPICNPLAYVGAVYAEQLTDYERELVFSGNFKRLIS